MLTQTSRGELITFWDFTDKQNKFEKKTRMHSSRMCTARSSSHHGGVSTPQEQTPPLEQTLPWQQTPLAADTPLGQAPPWE